MGLFKALFCSLLLTVPATSRPSPAGTKRDITGFVEAERATALDGVLANIGANGSLSQGAYPGVVIAAPSTVRYLSSTEA